MPLNCYFQMVNFILCEIHPDTIFSFFFLQKHLLGPAQCSCLGPTVCPALPSHSSLPTHHCQAGLFQLPRTPHRGPQVRGHCRL